MPVLQNSLKKLYDKRLEKCIDKNNTLSTSQYGFRTNMSTSHALIDLLEEMSTSLDKKKYTLGVFIDLKKRKSFSINRKTQSLWYKRCGRNWIKSYLCGRKQFVNIGECSPDLIQISCGVPQGSVLGPKLFILYINDICHISKLLKFILFADDTNMLYSDSNVHNLISTRTLLRLVWASSRLTRTPLARRRWQRSIH